MEQIVEAIGWFFLFSVGLGVLGSLTLALVRLVQGTRTPKIIGAELPIINASIDLSKRYDIVYGAGHGASTEKLAGVQILGYLRSDRDKTTGGYMDAGWLVVELTDGRRAYLRPQSVLWLLEAVSSNDRQPDRTSDA